MTAVPLKPYLRATRPNDTLEAKGSSDSPQFSNNQYLEDELKKLQVSVKSLLDAVKQLQDYIGSPPL